MEDERELHDVAEHTLEIQQNLPDVIVTEGNNASNDQISCISSSGLTDLSLSKLPENRIDRYSPQFKDQVRDVLHSRVACARYSDDCDYSDDESPDRRLVSRSMDQSADFVNRLHDERMDHFSNSFDQQMHMNHVPSSAVSISVRGQTVIPMAEAFVIAELDRITAEHTDNNFVIVQVDEGTCSTGSQQYAATASTQTPTTNPSSSDSGNDNSIGTGSSCNEAERNPNDSSDTVVDQKMKEMAVAAVRGERKFWIRIIVIAIVANTVLVAGVVVGGFCATGACSSSSSSANSSSSSSISVKSPKQNRTSTPIDTSTQSPTPIYEKVTEPPFEYFTLPPLDNSKSKLSKPSTIATLAPTYAQSDIDSAGPGLVPGLVPDSSVNFTNLLYSPTVSPASESVNPTPRLIPSGTESPLVTHGDIGFGTNTVNNEGNQSLVDESAPADSIGTETTQDSISTDATSSPIIGSLSPSSGFPVAGSIFPRSTIPPVLDNNDENSGHGSKASFPIWSLVILASVCEVIIISSLVLYHRRWKRHRMNQVNETKNISVAKEAQFRLTSTVGPKLERITI